MREKHILLFGYGSHGKHIAKGLIEDGFTMTIVESDPTYYAQAKEDGYLDVEQVDVTSDAMLKLLEPQKYDQIV